MTLIGHMGIPPRGIGPLHHWLTFGGDYIKQTHSVTN